jgi:hypothetical protein
MRKERGKDMEKERKGKGSLPVYSCLFFGPSQYSINNFFLPSP